MTDLKKYLRDSRFSLTTGDVDRSRASISQALKEFEYEKNKLENAKPLKQNLVEKFRGNLVLISSMAAAIITLFTFYELLKKKKESITKKITEVKITFEKKNNGDKKGKKSKAKKAEIKKDEKKK